jgi:hypothetical protein
MRTWQVERRKRTRHLIELGGLVVKARVVDLTGDDRAIILGALLWMADKLKSNQSEQARALWAAKGKEAFAAERATDAPAIARLGADRKSHRTAPAAPCADLCQQLLFKGNVDQVVIRNHSELGTKVVTKIGTTDNVLEVVNRRGVPTPIGTLSY